MPCNEIRVCHQFCHTLAHHTAPCDCLNVEHSSCSISRIPPPNLPSFPINPSHPARAIGSVYFFEPRKSCPLESLTLVVLHPPPPPSQMGCCGAPAHDLHKREYQTNSIIACCRIPISWEVAGGTTQFRRAIRQRPSRFTRTPISWACLLFHHLTTMRMRVQTGPPAEIT
jgi:hypothetical protein